MRYVLLVVLIVSCGEDVKPFGPGDPYRSVAGSGGASTVTAIGGESGRDAMGGDGIQAIGGSTSSTGGTVNAGGSVNTGGAVSSGGVSSSGGAVATGGVTSTGGTTSSAGGTGGTISGAATPCTGLCMNPTAPAGALGTGATCQEILGMYKGVYCTNFILPRMLSVNGVVVACVGAAVDLPPRRNGGYCVQATAGEYSYATFSVY